MLSSNGKDTTTIIESLNKLSLSGHSSQAKCLSDRATSRKPRSYYRVTNGLHFFRDGLRVPSPYLSDPVLSSYFFREKYLDRTFSVETDFQHPKRLGYFSCHINPDGKTQSYRHDKSSLRYLANRYPTRQIKLDIRSNYLADSDWGRVPPGEMHLLRWLHDNTRDRDFQSFSDSDEDEDSDDDEPREKKSFDFICYTRMLRTFMNTPFNMINDWMCVAVKVNGSIVLDEIDTPKRLEMNAKQSPKQRASSIIGYKFEEIITRRYDGTKRSTHLQGNRDSFYIVSQSKLNNHKILYCTRADCVTNKEQLNKTIEEMEFVQIKTRSKDYFNIPGVKEFFWKVKVVPWWIEAMLGGMDKIICGDKGPGFSIERVSRIQADELPRRHNRWSPRTSVSFLDSVLTYIKSMVTEELTPYRFYCDPRIGIICQKIHEPVANYIPTWFINNQEPTDD